MTRHVFDDDDIRGIVDSLEHPAMATRGAFVVAVNDVWLDERGFKREAIEGKPIDTFLATEERERLMQRTLLPDAEVSFEAPLRTIARMADGRILPVRVYTSRFHAKEPPDYRVTLVLAESAAGDLSLGRELLALSADLIGASSQEQIRERTRAAFVRAGFRTEFVADTSDPDVQRAIASKKPAFIGARSAAPEAVLVPLSNNEVVRVSGSGLTAQDSYALGFFAKLVSTALLDVQASEAARRKLSDTQLLLQLARTTSETLDLGVVMNVTADSLVQLLDVSSCFILLHDEQANVLRGGASSIARREHVNDIEISLTDETSIAAAAARERKPIVIPDTAADPRARRAPLVQRFGETALAAFPIVSRGRLEGVVLLDETRGPRAFTAEWVEIATAMVAQVGLSIANARLYESLRKSYDEVAATRAEMVKRERLAGLGELAAIVAHEVRNPLGVIYNATHSLKRLIHGSADGTTLVNIVREECERLNQIVGDLLDFARPRQLSMQPEDVTRVLGEVVEAIGTAPNVRFEVMIDDDLPMLVIDRRLMRQALINVALNGVQSMPRGGALRLRASIEREAGELVMEIADEGSGIPDADLPRIFEPFYTTKATGAGLGLAVVKRIIEDHGGKVFVQSSNAGTTFSLRLKLASS